MKPTPRRRRTKAQLEQARRRREATFKANLKARHRMTPEQYWAIYEFQGGLCYICLRASGKTKRLAVDHDHWIAAGQCAHPYKESCEQCWRGLLCGTCNKIVGHARNEAAYFERAIRYVTKPPAQEWLDVQFDRENS